MRKLVLMLLTSCVILPFNSLVAAQHTLRSWKRTKSIIKESERHNAKVAILIIAPPLENPTLEKWQLGEEMWRKCMNICPNVDCFFVRGTVEGSYNNEVWQEDNTIFVHDYRLTQYPSGGIGDYILNKTIKAIEFLNGKYTHFFRTNLNIFINPFKLKEYIETHETSTVYTGPIYEGFLPYGYGILFSAIS